MMARLLSDEAGHLTDLPHLTKDGETPPVATSQAMYTNGQGYGKPFREEDIEQVSRPVLEWIGKNIFAIIGISIATGLLAVPATRWQHDVLSAKVDKVVERVEKVEGANVQTLIWQSRVEAKLDQIILSPPPLAAPAPVTQLPPRRKPRPVKPGSGFSRFFR